jgi:hypothetical protein
MRMLKSSAWPWFLLGVVLSVIGLVVLDGAAGAIVHRMTVAFLLVAPGSDGESG